MARSVKEWIGATDDTPPPPRVKDRIHSKQDGCCAKCGRRLRPGHWDTDHTIALVNGGENRETNLQALCDDPCHPQKTKADVAEKSRTYERRAKHYGIKRKPKGRSSFRTNKDQPWKQKIGGKVVPRWERRRS